MLVTHMGGGVLSQAQAHGSNRAVSHFSKRLKPAEAKYSVADKEALVVMLTCRNFYHYLWGTRFTITVTDHQPITSIFKKKAKSPRMTRWVLEMREFSYQIQCQGEV